MIPRKKVKEYFSVTPQYLAQNKFESMNWWDNIYKSRFVQFFDSTLPRYLMPWAKNTEAWGSDDGNRIMLGVENDKVTDVFIRIDVGRLDEVFVESLVSFAEKNDFLFFTLESGKFIEPNISDFLEQIRESRAMLFVENPEIFFEKIKKLNLRSKIDL